MPTLDQRAIALINAARDALPKLDTLVGAEAEAVKENITSAVKQAEATGNSWDAEEIRGILFGYPKSRKFLEDRVPAAKDPRDYGTGTRAGSGGGGMRWL